MRASPLKAGIPRIYAWGVCQEIENVPDSVEVLDLSDNRIEKIENLPKSLKTLDISNNPVKFISYEAFDFIKKNRVEVVGADIYSLVQLKGDLRFYAIVASGKDDPRVNNTNPRLLYFLVADVDQDGNPWNGYIHISKEGHLHYDEAYIVYGEKTQEKKEEWEEEFVKKILSSQLIENNFHYEEKGCFWTIPNYTNLFDRVSEELEKAQKLTPKNPIVHIAFGNVKPVSFGDVTFDNDNQISSKKRKKKKSTIRP